MYHTPWYQYSVIPRIAREKHQVISNILLFTYSARESGQIGLFHVARANGKLKCKWFNKFDYEKKSQRIRPVSFIIST